MNVTRSLFYLALGLRFLFTHVCKKRATSTTKKSDKRYETRTKTQNQAYEPASAEITIETTDGSVHHQNSNITFEKLKESSVEKHDAGDLKQKQSLHQMKKIYKEIQKKSV